jgi:monomeric isocitrate dehydrogenase
MSHLIFGNSCNIFFSILADFGDLSEKLKSHVPYKLSEMLQYYNTVSVDSSSDIPTHVQIIQMDNPAQSLLASGQHAVNIRLTSAHLDDLPLWLIF